jgi:hypothetical protein
LVWVVLWLRFGKGLGSDANSVPLRSIREFCELSVPIIMFDKNSNFVVMKLEEVSV